MKVELTYPPEDAVITPKSVAEMIAYTLLLSKPVEATTGRRRVYIVTDEAESEKDVENRHTA